MKRQNNLYNKMLDINNIIDMTNLVLKNTHNKRKVNAFENYKMELIINIQNRLESGNFISSKYNIFLISDPKYRIIMAQELEDKIINHLVAKYILEDTFERKFVNSQTATRKEKGTSYSIKLLRKYLSKLKDKPIYYLKIDIKKYFYSLDHDILKNIKDKKALNILCEIIDSTNHSYINNNILNLKNKKINTLTDIKIINEINSIPVYKYNKGCPIGNQTSQIFGLIYLHELNHFVKEKLHLKYVINYMDDFVILSHDKNYLIKCLDIIKEKLKIYKLEINYKKTFIGNLKGGLDFLGYVFYIKNNKIYIKLRNRTKKKYIKITKELKLLLKNNYIDKKFYNMRLSSYKGMLKYNYCLWRKYI